MNKIIKTLIFSDFAILSGFGLISPIFALFITDNIKGGDLKVIGFATAIYLIVKSILQLPIAKYLDRDKQEKDDYVFLIIGSFLMALTPLFYLISKTPWHIYLTQFFYAIGSALAFPGYAAIFTRNADEHKEGFEWSVYSSLVSAGIAGAAALGGIIASKYGFKLIFPLNSLMVVIGSASLIWLYKPLKAKKWNNY